MSRITGILLKIARLVAGPARSEWIDAMAAEAEAINDGSTGWALGCVWAAVKGRFARDWWVVAAIVILPAAVLWCKMTIFFTTSSLLAEQQISPSLAVIFWIVSPFPIAALFAFWRNGRAAYLAAAIAFFLVELFPALSMWLYFGLSPAAWFGPNVNWYKADPGVAIGPAAGIALDALVWLGALWLGSSLGRRLTRQA